ncbi:hypothetical protein BH24ACI3_BH24ACI3_09080 [soil metagenome]
MCRIYKIGIAGFLFFLFGGPLYAQTPTDPIAPLPSQVDPRDERSRSMNEMIAKQRMAKAKKDHEQMVARGNEALEIAAGLEESLEQSLHLRPSDKKKVQELEKLVTRIRRDLGGGGDGLESFDEDERRPSDIREAITYLKDTTGKLVEELQKTTRCTIAAVAINTSNAVIRLTQFLRGRD